MLPAHSYKSIIDDIKDKSNEVKLIGILFARPENKIAKKEIVPNIDYFHLRSESNCNIYCVGYGAYWNKYDYPDMEKVKKVNGTPWYYSNEQFNNLRKEITQKFDWKYSGETDLILFSLNTYNKIDDTKAIVLNLEKMIKNKVITSINNFFEQIFDFCERYEDKNILFDLSNHLNLSEYLEDLKSVII